MWKGIERLRLRGIEVEAVPRRGYRLPQPVELLDGRAIRAAVRADGLRRLHRLELPFAVDSTNAQSADRAAAAARVPPMSC